MKISQLIILLCAFILTFCTRVSQESPSATQLVIKNDTNYTQTYYLTLAAVGGACPYSHPPITADYLRSVGFCSNVIESAQPPYAGRCKFTLEPKTFITVPNVSNTCLSGAITLGSYPGCPDKVCLSGYSSAEFTLNTLGTSQESLDVSLVNGVNSISSFQMKGGSNWKVTSTGSIVTQVTQSFGTNKGNPGIFPVNCTDCVRLVGPPVCSEFKSNPICQDERICAVQREAPFGGLVILTLTATK
jgi:hypothetical protein